MITRIAYFLFVVNYMCSFLITGGSIIVESLILSTAMVFYYF